MLTTLDMQPLAAAERDELRTLEDEVEVSRQRAGAALRTIRDKRLYRETHATFEDYLVERWEMSRASGYRQIEAAEIIENVSHWETPDEPALPPPTSERQARELAGLAVAEQRAVWREAVERSGGQPAPGRIVREVREQYHPRAPEPEPELELFPPPAPTLPHVAHNSGQNEWYTPAEFIAAARAVLGEIDLDPASTPEANAVVRATTFYTAEQDGLGLPWFGRVWMNPPYSAELIQRFIDKLAESVTAGEVTATIVLVNNATETAWFRTLTQISCALCLPTSRIRFWQPDGTKGAPLQGQAILYSGPNPDGFAAAFSVFGEVWRRTVSRVH